MCVTGLRPIVHPFQSMVSGRPKAGVTVRPSHKGKAAAVRGHSKQAAKQTSVKRPLHIRS